MKNRMKWAQIFFLTGVLGLAAPWAEARPDTRAPGPREARNSASYEAWLEKQVRHELLMLPYYSVFANLEFKIAGDRVILLGQVLRPSTKSDAEARVKKIEGVAGEIGRAHV